MSQSNTVAYLCNSQLTGCPFMKIRITNVQIHSTEPAATDATRSTFSGAADYDQTTPFNGIDGDTA